MTDEPSVDFDEVPMQLHLAAQSGDLKGVKKYLDEGLDPNVFDDLSKTPLHYAAEGEHIDVVQLLLSRGANVNIREDSSTNVGNTVLAHVAAQCSIHLARVLLDAG